MIANEYNPLIDKNSIYYQTIATNKRTTLAPMDKLIHRSSQLLLKKKYNCFQLNEITNINIQNFIKTYLIQNNKTLKFDKSTGWFTKQAFRNLKKLIDMNLH